VQQASYKVVECVVHYLNLNVIESFLTSTSTSSPTAGFISYSSSVTALLTEGMYASIAASLGVL